MKHRPTDIRHAHDAQLAALRVLPRPIYGQASALPNRAIARRHSHPWAQLSYALQGVIEVSTVAGRFIAPPLRGIWIPAGHMHGVICSDNTVIRSLYIDTASDPRKTDRCEVLLVGSLLRELIHTFSAIPVEYDKDGPDGRLAEVLLDQLACAQEVGLVLPWPQSAALRRFCATLQSEPGSGMTLLQFSRQLGVSEKTLSRMFREQTGLSFRLWRQRSRLLGALPMLERGDRVTDVALACGYESMSAFIASFRKHMGATPGEFFRARATTSEFGYAG